MEACVANPDPLIVIFVISFFIAFMTIAGNTSEKTQPFFSLILILFTITFLLLYGIET
jgi:asparagine N-glycosylation enzyme membrane subunit Stt3